MKHSFTKASKREERELKLKRILRECDAVKETKEFFDYDIDNAKIKVEWSGSYPNLCSGEWTIRINEMVIPIPEERIGSSMGTCGEYSRWYFGENYEEHTEHYYDVDDSEWSNNDNWLKYAIWCLAEYHSLRFIGDLDRLYDRIYNEITENDWRSGSCVGCIINKINKMKKVQYISDIHLEMYPNGDYWAENKIEPVADILVLAGDISKLSKMHYSNPFFDQVSKDFKQVFWVPGNHEYYDLTDLNILNKESLDIDIRDNVKIVNNKSINYDGINFIFSTFWSEIPISYARNVTRGMMCFRHIKYLGVHFEPKYIGFGKYNRLHQDSVYFLKNALADIDNEDPIVVVTHHAPTIYVVSEEFKTSTIRHGFYSEQMPLIKSSRFIDFWIYGHTHRNVDFELDGTQIVSNQQGYVHMGEHSTFNPTKYIEV